MNKLITTLVVLSLSFFMYGQRTINKQPLPLATFNDNVKAPLTAKEKNQIIEVYGDNAEKYVFSKPHMLKTIKHILRNRVVITKLPKKELSSFKNLSEITKFSNSGKNTSGDFDLNIEAFNPLKYNFNFYSRDRIKYFRIDNTQYLITILPQHTR